MLEVVERVDLDDVAFVVLEAGGRSWYPGRFWQPHAAHVPWLDQSIAACEQAFDALQLEPGRVVVGGFSQGACVTAEWVVQRPRAYAGVAILTGSLMGTHLGSRELPPLGGPARRGGDERVRRLGAVRSRRGVCAVLRAWGSVRRLPRERGARASRRRRRCCCVARATWLAGY